MLSGCYFCTSRVWLHWFCSQATLPPLSGKPPDRPYWTRQISVCGVCACCAMPLSFSNTDIFFFFFSVSQGLHDQALEDCEKALQLNEGNYKALYRKAKSLKEMGRHQEAYEAVAECSLAVPQVSCTNLYKSLNEFHLNEFNKPKIPVQMLPRQQTTHPVESCWFWIVAWCVGLRAG